MTMKSPNGRSRPSDAINENANSEVVCTEDIDISPVGLLCDSILSVVSLAAALPDAAKINIGIQISNILALFNEQEERERAAIRKLVALKGNLRLAKEQLAVLRQELFDKSSERDDPDDEEVLDLGSGLEDDEEEEEPKQPLMGKRPRKIPKDNEPLVVHHYPEDRTCTCCGTEMPSIGSWDSMRMRIVPEHVEFINNVYHKCACNRTDRCKENKPVSAKAQNYIMWKRGVEPGFAVEAAVQKFFEHIPTYRMERRLQNTNINLRRQSISSIIAVLAGHLEPVRLALLDHVKAGHVVHADETPVRIQAPGKGKCDTGYFWAFCRDERNWNPEAEPAVVYKYDPSRAGTVAKDVLDGASIRFLATDGHGGYNQLFRKPGANDGMDSARCWAHARRKFFETHLATKSPEANKIVKLIRKMYAVEKAARGLPPEEREKLRQEQSLPVLTEIRAELEKNAPKASGVLKQAINYTLKAFDALQRFIFDGRIEIDNNAVERCIRGIALTKKNSLFAGNHQAARVWAIYYSLIESARLNGINPRRYLNWVVEQIEVNKGDVDHSALLPWHCPFGRIEK